MADLGAIAMRGNEAKSTVIGPASLQYTGLGWVGQLTKGTPDVGRRGMRYQSLTAGMDQLALGGEDITTGDASAPCLRMDARGRWRFRWVLTVGSHSISILVKQAINQNPRPSLVVKNNPAIGINSDIETFAPSGADWVTISSPAFTVTTLGATWVELRNNLETNVGFSPAYWDHVVKT